MKAKRVKDARNSKKKTAKYKNPPAKAEGLLYGAGEGNRTLVSTLARSRSTIEPRPRIYTIYYIKTDNALQNRCPGSERYEKIS